MTSWKSVPDAFNAASGCARMHQLFMALFASCGLECRLKYRVSIHPLYLGLNRTDGEASVGRSAAVWLLFCLNVERILKPNCHGGDFTTYWGPCVSPEAVCLLLSLRVD